ncbi:MAG: alpha/beta hydrolase [Bacteroidota bacterium]
MKKWLSTSPGTLIHEMRELLPFWYTVFTRRITQMNETKIKYGNSSRQYFLFFLPHHQPITQKNIIIYFHGGGWSLGKPEYFRAHAWQFVQRGYAVVMPSHRRIPRFSHRDMREDLILLLQQLEKVVGEHQWTGQHLILGGTSSGGTLAAHLAFDDTIVSQLKTRLRGLFLLSAPLDLSKMKMTPVLRAYIGNNLDEASLNSFCPMHTDLPILLIHGKKDAIVEHESSASFVQQLKDNQCTNIQFHSLPEGIHLDASRWGYEDNKVRQWLLNWIHQQNK